jgi:hypothetical protein
MIGSALGASFAIALAFSPFANATEVEGYSFTNAAQEVTQLFWLAETASACGWAAPDEATKFKLFALRFLSAHLSDANQRALLSLVTEPKYEDQLRRAAVEGARAIAAAVAGRSAGRVTRLPRTRTRTRSKETPLLQGGPGLTFPLLCALSTRNCMNRGDVSAAVSYRGPLTPSSRSPSP